MGHEPLAASRPLDGIRVLDLTRYLAGPFATMLLADYGADVIKVESAKGREFRLPGATRDSYFFLSSNRGTCSVVIECGLTSGVGARRWHGACNYSGPCAPDQSPVCCRSRLFGDATG